VPQVLVAGNASFGALVSTMPANPTNASFGFPWVAGGFRLEFFGDVAAGQTVSETISLRFVEPESPNAPTGDYNADRLRGLLEVANDTFADWRNKVPITMKWPDRGPIGGLFPSNYPGCKTTADCPNPRGWTWMPKASPPITTSAGIQAFTEGALQWMNESVRYCVNYMGDGKKGPALCQGLTGELATPSDSVGQALSISAE